MRSIELLMQWVNQGNWSAMRTRLDSMTPGELADAETMVRVLHVEIDLARMRKDLRA